MGGQSGSGRFPPPRLTRDPTRRALLPSARPEPPRRPRARSRGPAPGSHPCSRLAQGRPARPAGLRPPGSRGPQGAAARLGARPPPTLTRRPLGWSRAPGFCFLEEKLLRDQRDGKGKATLPGRRAVSRVPGVILPDF